MLDPDPHQLEKWDPDLHQNVLCLPHRMLQRVIFLYSYIPPLSQLAKIFFHYPNLFSYSFIIQTSLLNYFIILTHSFILTSSDHILEQYYFPKYIYFNCPRPLRNNCCASMNLSKMIVLLWHVLSIA